MTPKPYSLVVIESPYTGDIEGNTVYARACMLDSLNRGEYPFVSHLLYTQVLNDAVPKQREQGIAANIAWLTAADFVAVYCDKGITKGMDLAITAAVLKHKRLEFRMLEKKDPV